MDKQAFLTRFLLQTQPSCLDLRTTDKSPFVCNDSLKKAAVLIPVVRRNNELQVIFTKRAQHLRHHPGQFSFPGGQYEQSDKDLQHTALRETEEEIGIKPDQVTILGRLPKLPTISGFVVTPYIGFVQSNHSLKIDRQEVSSLLEVPLEFLMNKNNFYLHHLIANKKRHFTYCIPYKNQMIWGATAQMVKNLQQQLNRQA